MNKKLRFYVDLFLPLVLGGIVGILINNNINYPYLIKPPLSPSGIVFPIVWSILYFLIGLSYALFHYKNNNKYISLTYYLQLFFNILWSFIFFSYNLRGLAIIWIIILDILVLILFFLYLKHNNRISAYLIIPYIVWILFATYLTIGVYILN